MFEDYLREIHVGYSTAPDDDIPDEFEKWLGDLDIDTLIHYGQKFSEIRFLEGEKAGIQRAMQIVDECKQEFFKTN